MDADAAGVRMMRNIPSRSLRSIKKLARLQ